MTKQLANRVFIIGGGAAGITAAIAARRNNAEVTILERNERIGRKILATGNGRCNLTNSNIHVNHYHGQNPKFVYGALNRFDYRQTIDFFEHLGIAHKIEEGGKVFPVSNQASSVLDVLRYELEQIGVKVICEADVCAVKNIKNTFEIVLKDKRKFKADRVILTTGGKSSPNLGSNGSGYILAQSLGHNIIKPFPALVRIQLAEKFLKQIQGVKFDGEAEIIVDNKSLARAGGEILFTQNGISGPPILQLSRTAGEYLQKKKKVWLKVTLITGLTAEQLEQVLINRFQNQPQKTLAFSFVGFINKRLIPVLLKEAGIENINKPAAEVTAGERQRIINILQDWRFEVTGTDSWPASQVTAGGVDVKDINPKTMESKLVPNLYFAGEILDIDGDCGGFNLQWAWSSGYVAGESAAQGD
ncbi:NAD(P)/FAD-dependent oxidoreductase [Desulfolucanica intricata]|uniref:NAD(P)/FAD-dependent oxidoreductase n=1 Tax=Desulfolucanica intricata TaxID=1285191 RepID=UPI00082C5685|nr:NAD(P)/FAD-dependent oxidoreductase [Desulfolucanica intricata]